jgi:hypothetical protein
MTEILVKKLEEKFNLTKIQDKKQVKFLKNLLLFPELQRYNWGATPTRNAQYMMLLTDLVLVDIEDNEAVDEFMNV